MSKVLKTAAIVVGAVALIASGVGAVGAAGLLGSTIAAGGTIAGIATAATLTTIGTLGALAAGLATVASGLTAKKPSANATGSQTDFSANPDAGIPLAIGRTGTAGDITARFGFDTRDKGDNDRQSFVATLSLGPIAAIEGMTVDRNGVTYGPTGAAIGAFAGFMWSMTQLGAMPEPAALSFGAGAGTPPGWTAAHKMSGKAAASWTLRFDTNAKLFQNGVPAPMWTVRGALCYDPTKDSTYPGGSGSHRMADPADTAAYDAAMDTWQWTENPYLVGLHWAHGFWQRDRSVAGSKYQRVMGMGANWSGIDVPAFVEGRNISAANGWKVGGMIYSADVKWDTMKKILQAGMGEPLALGARISCLVNAPKVSLATITIDDVIGAASVAATQPRRSRINTITPRYRLEENNWQLLPGAPISVAEHVAEDRGKRTKVQDYPFIQQTPQVATAVRYDIENAREFGPIILPLKLVWMGYKPGDCVTAILPELGLASQPILLLNRELGAASGVVTMTARSETAAKHPFALGQTATPPRTPGVSGPPLVPVPGENAWVIADNAVAANGSIVPALIVTGAVDAATIEAVILEYRAFQNGQSVDAGWIGAGSFAPDLTRADITSVAGGTEYEVSVSYQRKGSTGLRRILGPVATSGTALDFAVVTGPTRPANNATNTADTNAPFGPGQTVGGIIADFDKVSADLGSALVDVGNANAAVGRLDAAVATFQGKIDDALVQFGSFDLVMPSVLKLAQLVQTTNAIVRARTTLDNQPIGTVVDDVRTKTETVVEDVSLMGARSFDRSSFLINLKTVMVDGKTSLGQRLEQIEAKGANDLNAVVSDLVTVIVDGETATARRLTNVEASAKGLAGTVSGLSQVIADGDKVQADRIDIVEAGISGPGGISAKVQELTSATVGADGSSLASKITVLQSQLNTEGTGVFARVGTLENTVTKGPNSHAERLTTVEAGVSGPNGVSAKVQELTSATIGADGSSLASKVTVLQSQLNSVDTGVYARIGTLENTVTKGPNSHAERLTTVEAGVSGPNGVSAKVQELSTATVGGPGTDSLAQKISTVQAQLNTPDTGLFARVGTLNNALFQGGNAIATRLDSVEASVGKDPESGLRAQVSFLTTATVTATGNAIAKAVLSLDALGRVVGTTATNDGRQGTFDIVFDRTRIVRPDGTLLFRAGGVSEGEDPNAVYMPNIIVDRLRLGSVGTLEIGLGAIRQVFAVELTSNPSLPATNGQQITYLTLYINKQRAESSLRISYNMRPRPGRDYAASFILGRQPLDGSVKTTMDTSQFWAASCLINNLRSVRIPMNLSRTFDGLPAGEYLITVDIIAIGGGNDQGFMEAGSNLYVEEVKR